MAGDADIRVKSTTAIETSRSHGSWTLHINNATPGRRDERDGQNRAHPYRCTEELVWKMEESYKEKVEGEDGDICISMCVEGCLDATLP